MRNVSMFKNFLSGLKKTIKKENGFWEYVATIAIVLVILAFIGVPQLRTFATTVFTKMGTWWTGIANNVFQPS